MGREALQDVHGRRQVRAQRVQEDVVGSGVEMVAQAAHDGMLVPPGERGVDEPVAAVVGQV
jgi:hypothetical protein